MYTMMIPNRSRCNPGMATRAPWLDDRFFRSFFNMNDWLADVGFRVAIQDEKDQYLMEAELPGVAMDQINLTVEDNTLTIAADLEQHKEEDANAYYSERRTGHISRSFKLDGIDQENITADYKNGILTVRLPKEHPADRAGQRRITIGDGSAPTQAE